MATIGTNYQTLADWSIAHDENGSLRPIVEILTQQNDILNDAIFRPTNQSTTHKEAIRTGLPAPTWRAFNQGVAPTKGVEAVVEFGTGQAVIRQEVDAKLANLEGDPVGYRASQARAALAGMGNDVALKMFYGNEALVPTEFTGFARYYSTTTASSGENLVLAGGSGSDNTSVYAVTWGESDAFGLFPRGTSFGYVHEDLLTRDVTDASGNKFNAYVDEHTWTAGLCVKDWRACGRIANIDVSDLRDTGATGVTAVKALVRNMIIMSERLRGTGTPKFYMNRVVKTALRLGILERAVNNLTFETVAGKEVMMFDGIPVGVCEAISNAESLVS